MEEVPTHNQRMYLAKGDMEDLYIDTVCLPHHQYDGIRFLYKQFKKGKAGVILNDPSGYGKRIQTVLFINALRPILKSPILVLCTEGKEQLWVQLFQQWTKMGHDVSIQKNNAETVRSACVVSAVCHAAAGAGAALARREWSVLVVDDRAVSREALRASINANYKIWITSLDMKKNLQTFSLIYKFLNPRERFIVEDFEAIKKTPSLMLTRSAKLDAFMEDIVLRRKLVSAPLGMSSETIQPAPVSRKNKDPTGKKTKRSKPKPVAEQEMYSKSCETCSGPQDCAILPTVTKNGLTPKSLDDFIVNIKSTVQTVTDTDAVDKDDNALQSDARKRKIDEDFINDIRVKIVDKPDEIDPNFEDDPIVECKSLDVDKHSPSLFSEKLIITHNNDMLNEDEKIKNYNIPTRTIHKSSVLTYKNNQDESEEMFSESSVSNYNQSENKVSNFNININTANVMENEGVTTIEVVEVKTDGINRNKDELVNKNNVNEHKKTDPKLDSLELKMKQMEELAVKKFKGSFLDNMF